MKSARRILGNIHFDHSIWLNELIYTRGEIKIYETRLQKLIDTDKKQDGKRALSNLLEEFIEQKKAVIRLRKQIKKHVLNMSQKIHSNGELSAIADTVHQNTREQMAVFRQNYADLKEKFHQFAAVEN